MKLIGRGHRSAATHAMVFPSARSLLLFFFFFFFFSLCPDSAKNMFRLSTVLCRVHLFASSILARSWLDHYRSDPVKSLLQSASIHVDFSPPTSVKGNKLFKFSSNLIKKIYWILIELLIKFNIFLVISRPRKFMVLKMAKYGLKNMLIWS